jgi:hypothetical protein
MEGIALLGLLGIGYLFVDDKDENKENIYRGTSKLAGNESSVYDVNNLKDSLLIEQELANKLHNKAIDGNSTIIDDTLNMNNRNTTAGNSKKTFVESLSGQMLSEGDFLKNDQNIKFEPFFSKAPANVNFDENTNLTNHQGGTQAFRAPRKELGQFFDLEKNLGNVFGNTFEGPSSDQERYISGNYRQGELPFQQERVSHIDEKSSINQDVAVAYANRNSIDNTRVVSNPKLSYRGKVLGGKNNIDRRGEEGEIYKHLPNQDYLQTADRWLVTTGAITGKTNRPEQVIKDTNRQYFNEGKIGPAAPVSFVQQENQPMFKKSTNQQLASDTDRNVTLENKAHDDSHNKDSYYAYPNERDKTTGRNHVSNLKSMFSAKTMEVQDAIRPTVKETTSKIDYVGIAGHETQAPSAIDQYDRADLNPNKEIISRGRNPTPESTKLTNGVDTKNIFIKKIESDYFNRDITNQNKLYTVLPGDTPEEYTKEKNTLDNVQLSDRLDPTMLNPFKTNPYTQSLSSYGYS